MGIKAIIFDVGGVLLTLGEEAYRQEVTSRLGPHVLPEHYSSKIPALQRGEETEELLWAKLAGRSVPADAFDSCWLAHFRPIPAMLLLAAELRALGLRTAVLSNTQASHVRLMRSMGVLAGFDPIVMSCEASCRKPEPQAFYHILDRLRLPGEAVAYVDDVPEYVAAAMALGIRAILHSGDVLATRRSIVTLLDEPG